MTKEELRAKIESIRKSDKSYKEQTQLDNIKNEVDKECDDIKNTKLYKLREELQIELNRLKHDFAIHGWFGTKSNCISYSYRDFKLYCEELEYRINFITNLLETIPVNSLDSYYYECK